MSNRRSSLIYGRRTGVDIFKGKIIRKQQNGRECFEDYWSEPEKESEIDSLQENSSKSSKDSPDINSGSNNDLLLRKGRRTGVEVLKKKKMRKLQNRCDNYEDYWSNSECAESKTSTNSRISASDLNKNKESSKNDSRKRTISSGISCLAHKETFTELNQMQTLNSQVTGEKNADKKRPIFNCSISPKMHHIQNFFQDFPLLKAKIFSGKHSTPKTLTKHSECKVTKGKTNDENGPKLIDAGISKSSDSSADSNKGIEHDSLSKKMKKYSFNPESRNSLNLPDNRLILSHSQAKTVSRKKKKYALKNNSVTHKPLAKKNESENLIVNYDEYDKCILQKTNEDNLCVPDELESLLGANESPIKKISSDSQKICRKEIRVDVYNKMTYVNYDKNQESETNLNKSKNIEVVQQNDTEFRKSKGNVNKNKNTYFLPNSNISKGGIKSRKNNSKASNLEQSGKSNRYENESEIEQNNTHHQKRKIVSNDVTSSNKTKYIEEENNSEVINSNKNKKCKYFSEKQMTGVSNLHPQDQHDLNQNSRNILNKKSVNKTSTLQKSPKCHSIKIRINSESQTQNVNQSLNETFTIGPTSPKNSKDKKDKEKETDELAAQIESTGSPLTPSILENHISSKKQNSNLSSKEFSKKIRSSRLQENAMKRNNIELSERGTFPSSLKMSEHNQIKKSVKKQKSQLYASENLSNVSREAQKIQAELVLEKENPINGNYIENDLNKTNGIESERDNYPSSRMTEHNLSVKSQNSKLDTAKKSFFKNVRKEAGKSQLDDKLSTQSETGASSNIISKHSSSIKKHKNKITDKKSSKRNNKATRKNQYLLNIEKENSVNKKYKNISQNSEVRKAVLSDKKNKDFVRRSNRQRFPVLEHWRNERLLYVARKGIPSLLGIDKGNENALCFTKPDGFKPKTQIENLKQKLADKEPPIAVKLFDTDQKREVEMIVCGKHTSGDWNYNKVPSKNVLYRSKNIFETKCSAFGFIEIMKNKQKPTQYMPNEDLYIIVLKGNIKVFLQGCRTFEVSENGLFIVPARVNYSILNIGNTTARLAYCVGMFNFMEELAE